jgi:hypothetical protein
VDVGPGTLDGRLDGGQRLLSVDQHVEPVARAQRRVHLEPVAVRLEDVVPAELAQPPLVVSAQHVLQPVAETFVDLVHERP